VTDPTSEANSTEPAKKPRSAEALPKKSSKPGTSKGQGPTTRPASITNTQSRGTTISQPQNGEQITDKEPSTSEHAICIDQMRIEVPEADINSKWKLEYRFHAYNFIKLLARMNDRRVILKCEADGLAEHEAQQIGSNLTAFVGDRSMVASQDSRYATVPARDSGNRSIGALLSARSDAQSTRCARDLDSIFLTRNYTLDEYRDVKKDFGIRNANYPRPPMYSKANDPFYWWQLAGCHDLRKICRKRKTRGAILADQVGLGKTHIALLYLMKVSIFLLLLYCHLFEG
jgi:hypothetical protein